MDSETGEPSNRDPHNAGSSAFLVALANRRRVWTPLSDAERQRVDDFLAGRLTGGAEAQAEHLVRSNAFAAERVFERRLLTEAAASRPPPTELTRRILRLGEGAAERARPAQRSGRWSWLTWRTGGSFAVACSLLIVGVVLLTRTSQITEHSDRTADAEYEKNEKTGAPVRMAMATVKDRDLLFEASDVRLRNASGSGGGATAPPRYRDVQVPIAFLKDLLARASMPSATVGQDDFKALFGGLVLPSANDLIALDDVALLARSQQRGDSVQLRIYDLRDPRSADLRRQLGVSNQGEPAYLVTVRP
jgi:hypothetical protein